MALVLTIMGICTTSLHAPTVWASTEVAAETSIEIRGEVTGYKYKTIDGVKYKRLWSYTYNRWVDSEWTKV